MRSARLIPLVFLVAAAACSPTNKPPPLTNVTPATHTFFPITSGEVHELGKGTRNGAIACESCHPADGASYKDFTCLACHKHAQPVNDRLHGVVIGYSYDSTRCISCHSQGRKLLPYTHANDTIVDNCAQCHDVDNQFAALPVANFTHPSMGGSDCGACHVKTSWKGANGTPPGFTHDPNKDVTVNALIPTWSATIITAVTPQTQTLPMNMNHASTQIAPEVLGDCTNCHEPGTTYPGLLHSSIENYGDGGLLRQPGACSDCHTTSPTGFVGPTATAPPRTPATGEMKHDAVTWSAGAPTATKVVPSNCGTCHSPPSRRLDAKWTNGRANALAATFHSSLADAGEPQPGSCVDCHANSRPAALLNSMNSSLAAGLEFDHGSPRALDDCQDCHARSATVQFADWTGGRFHRAGDTNPTTCLPCHAGARPTSTTGWMQANYRNRPFDYVTNAAGITHGGGQDCAVCHTGPGTGGAWGSNQNWQGGHFPHGAGTIATRTCIACHMTQRPDLLSGTTPAAMAALLGFDHSLNGTGECFGCHQATVTAGSYVNYFNPMTGMLPNGDWKGGQAYPGSTFVSTSGAFITVTETKLNRSGPNNLVTSTSSSTATLYNGMLHDSPVVPAALNAGSTAMPDYAKCWHCHTNDAGVVTEYRNGRYHQSLTTYAATPGGTVTPFPQPTSRCRDCHTQMLPNDIVQKAGSNLQPMDHSAQFTAAVMLGGQSVTAVNQADCSACHKTAAGTRWDDGQFHTNIGSATPRDCVNCHYPLMADAARSDLASGTTYAMKHRSGQITTQACQTCHTTALSRGATMPIAATLWRTGGYHTNLTTQPTACVDCHSNSDPAGATQSSVTYALTMGATATNTAQWMTHTAAFVNGKDCAVCHAADARRMLNGWSKASVLHAAGSSLTTCRECHGLTNGNGSTVGTGNNMPAGLNDSSTVTTASAATGVPAGTKDQLTHTDPNVTSHECRFCHTQAGVSTTPGVQGKEWAQAKFHTSFNTANPLVINGTTARCSNCHMNVKPGASYAAQDHSAFTTTSTQDCSACHSYPGTGTVTAANWLGAAGMPATIAVGGFTIPVPPAAAANTVQQGIANLPHPAVPMGVACTTCHAMASGGKQAIGYDHASTLINTRCNACHEAGSNLVGTLWNNATTQTAGAGDTRPFTLTTINTSYKGNSGNFPNSRHFYPVDCYQCHVVPPGNGLVTTGAAYKTAWRFPHTQSRMTNPSTCLLCHRNGVPD